MAKRAKRGPHAAPVSKASGGGDGPDRSVRARFSRLEDRKVWLAFGALVVVGIVLRILLSIAQTPGAIGISDSVYYILAAKDDLFMWTVGGGNAWPAGYPLFLRIVHGIDSHLWFLVTVQHLLGIATALLLFLTVRRVAPAVWGLVPAAVILLAGPQMFLEHAPMTEALFGFLIAAFLYCLGRALVDHPQLWAALAGALAATAACVRVSGLPFTVVAALWLLAVVAGSFKRRATVALIAVLASVGILGLYLADMKRQTGYGGPALTRAGNYGSPTRGGSPGSNIDRVLTGMTGYWSAGDRDSAQEGYSYDGVMRIMQTPAEGSLVDMATYYPTTTPVERAGLLTALQRYERRTRVEGVLFMLLLALGVAGTAIARGRRLAMGVLALAVAAVTLVVPVAYVYFDARYAVPGYGSLAAAGAIGGATLWERLAAWRGRAIQMRPERSPSGAKTGI